MSFGMIILVVLTLLILFGVLQRVLDRMALSDKQALLITAAIFVGGWFPDLRLGAISINIGGALIPLVVSLYLIIRAGSAKERIRCFVASGLTTAAIYAIGMFFPADPVTMPFDPMPLYGVCGGAIAWFLGRSRRSALVAGILGVILSDFISGINTWRSGVNQVLLIGGAGALDAIVLSGVTSVLVCELIGEICERISDLKTKNMTTNNIRGGEHA